MDLKQPTQKKNKLDNVDLVCQKFLDDFAITSKPVINSLPPFAARILYEDLAQAEPLSGQIPKKAVEIEDRTLHIDFKGDIRIRALRPEGSKETRLPIIMYFHGGGWVLGSTDTHDRILRELATGVNSAVIFVDYERSPEVQYPLAIEQAYDATRSMLHSAKELNLDSTRIAVAGDGAGGNIATVVALLAKKRRGPKIAKQVLFYPITDANFLTSSYEQFADDYFLTRETMKWYWDSYLPELPARLQSTAAPLRASSEELSGLPPALITTNENDVLRDEGEAYAKKLAMAGVPVTAVRMLGMIHDNLVLGNLTETPGSKAAVELAIAHLRKALAS
jgi:acetyl esterase